MKTQFEYIEIKKNPLNNAPPASALPRQADTVLHEMEKNKAHPKRQPARALMLLPFDFLSLNS